MGVVAVVVIAGAFFTGTYVGAHSQLKASQLDIVQNKDNPLAASVDFAPFWKAWQILNEKFVSSKPVPPDQARVWGAIQGLASSLGDPYTTFFPPAESKIFQGAIAGNFEGIGLEVALKDNILTAVAPLKGSPAEKAGLKPADKILQINGTTTTNISVEKAVELIRGKKGTTVTLTILREGKEEPFDVKVMRDVIDLPTLETETRPDGIFVIRLYSFTATSPDLFRDALRKFYSSHSDKLIIDLRGNPGGYLEAAVDMASWFLPAGKVVVSEDFGKNGAPEIYRSKGYNVFPHVHMVILVDNGSASASEIFAGAMQEHGIAKLVGTKTFGKGSVQELVPITSETSLKVTVARWLTPNGISISEGGLKPDFDVKITQDDITKKTDPQLNKAVELLLAR